MKEKKITLQDIADQAQVSKALVSRVLNNRPVRVSAKKREQILDIAKRCNYVGLNHHSASSQPSPLRQTIALILPNLDYSFMSVIADTITSVAAQSGYSVILFDGKGDSKLELHYLELCHSMRVAGIILDSFISANNKVFIDMLSGWQIPFVFIDCYPNEAGVSFVSSQNRNAMFQLTERLIQRGHKNILSIIQDKSSLANVSLERLNGYYAAMDKYGLSGYNEIIYPGLDYSMQPIFSLMNSSVEFSAFIIHTASDVANFCDLLPYTKYSGNHEYEIGVFDDFKISFSDYITGRHSEVYRRIVSIVSQKPAEIASQAVGALLRRIQEGSSFKPVQLFIDCELINLTP